jgi:hypothetical protein
MAKVWYCPKCGYEVTSRGRCHSCREKLVASALPPLPAGSEEDEVGYRLETWTDRDRGRLIISLNDVGILHRFEEDELVVDAEDEARVDDLIAEVFEDPDPPASPAPAASGVSESAPPLAPLETDGPLDEAVHRLDQAAARLRDDPTDMQADADVAESSAAIFMADSYRGCSEEEWAAVGRVTRRLLAVLGAEEALEDEIRSEATVLTRLLDGILVHDEGPAMNVSGEQTEYEFPEWMPEQRIQLGMRLDEAGIPYRWDEEDLVVPSDRESEVEALFETVGGVEDEDDEERYTAVAELFAACGRLAADPTDENRVDAVLTWAHAAKGPPLLGMDIGDWLRITSRVKDLVAAIEDDEGADVVLDEAIAVHDLLRAVV